MEKFTLDREKTVLLVIDIQERLVPVMKYKDQVIGNTKILLHTAREMDFPVVVTEQYPKGLGSTVSEIKEDLQDAKIFAKNSFTAYIDEVKRSEEHTSELQSRGHLVCRLLLEKKNQQHRRKP